MHDLYCKQNYRLFFLPFFFFVFLLLLTCARGVWRKGPFWVTINLLTCTFCPFSDCQLGFHYVNETTNLNHCFKYLSYTFTQPSRCLICWVILSNLEKLWVNLFFYLMGFFLGLKWWWPIAQFNSKEKKIIIMIIKKKKRRNNVLCTFLASSMRTIRPVQESKLSRINRSTSAKRWSLRIEEFPKLIVKECILLCKLPFISNKECFPRRLEIEPG